MTNPPANTSTSLSTYNPREPDAETREMIRMVAGTDFVPAGLRGNPHAVYACVLAGRELGIGPMESLREIHMIDGRPSMSAKLMLGLVRRAGHSVTGKRGSDRAEVTGTRADNGDTFTVEWTIDDAKRAGLLNKKVWQRYPSEMLWARAVSTLCRALFSDVLTSVKYTPDEVDLPREDIALDAVDALPVVEPPEPAAVPMTGGATATVYPRADAVTEIVADHGDGRHAAHIHVTDGAPITACEGCGADLLEDEHEADCPSGDAQLERDEAIAEQRIEQAEQQALEGVEVESQFKAPPGAYDK